jgi:hypothetical protein
LKAQAKMAKHSAFIMNTGYRPMKGAAISSSRAASQHSRDKRSI